MNYNEFAEKIKAKYPEYNDMDNRVLAEKMVAKFPNEYSDVTFDDVNSEPMQENKGIDLTPTGIGESIGKAIVTPIVAMRDDIPLKEAYTQVQKVQTPKLPAQDLIQDLALYGNLAPLKAVSTVGKVGSYLGNAALQGGLPMGLEALKRGDNALSGFGTGTSIGLGLQSLPYVGKVAPIVSKKLGTAFASVSPETLEQAIKPNSNALELNEKTAQNLLMNTTERIRNAYNNLLTKKGNVVGQLLNNLPNDVKFKAGDVLQDIDKIYNNYSLSKNADLNPAINATQKELGKIEDMLYTNGKDNVASFLNDIEQAKYPKYNFDISVNKNKGKFSSNVLDTLSNKITYATRKFNKDVLDKIKSNPNLLNDNAQVENFESIIETIGQQVPDEIRDEMFTKFYNIVDSSSKLNKASFSVSPKELYDINKNVADMVDWKATDAATKNDVLSQIYGANAERIGNLSPELQEANKVYSDLMDFQNNEGIRSILNKQDKIDTASSALRNYNSTVTKGNTNRNIQDLERILVNEGEAPFLNDIDDVNAAMDLLNSRTTGRNFLGATDLIKNFGVVPALRGIREFNRTGIPQKVNQVISPFAERLLTPTVVEGMAPLLYGEVTNY